MAKLPFAVDAASWKRKQRGQPGVPGPDSRNRLEAPGLGQDLHAVGGKALITSRMGERRASAPTRAARGSEIDAVRQRLDKKDYSAARGGCLAASSARRRGETAEGRRRRRSQ